MSFFKLFRFKRIIVFTLLLAALVALSKWNNGDINKNYILDIHACIYTSLKKQSLTIDDFEINYVKNSVKSCINPSFPSIHIRCPHKDCNAWLHIVHTDRYSQKYRLFIDALLELHPFYTIQADFYDAPCWRYTFFSKPLTYWKGHAYAVQIDENKKVVKIYGGIEWGFTFTRFSLYPSCITPRKLTKEEQDFDFAFFNNKQT